MDTSLLKYLQIIIAVGLLNVWLIRSNWRTAYRGGDAKTLREEFAIYGLSNSFWSFIGVLKVGAALFLLAGIWLPALVLPAAILVSALMVGAVLMHFKVKDPVRKSVPAAVMLVLSLVVCVLSAGAV